MALIYGCITPHGGPVIGEIAGDQFENFRPTRVGMEELGRRMKAHQPDTIIILTPHGLRLKGHIAVYTCEYSGGSMRGGGQTVSTRFACDKEMALQILAETEAAQIPVVGCNYGALSGPASHIEMDWGTMIPLWFMGAKDEVKPKIIVIGPTREIPLEQLVTFGDIIAKVAEQSGKRVALVASADQGHAHDPQGPYGYDPAAAEYDQQICAIVKENRLADLLTMDLAFVDRAKPDSLWQMLILHGATKVVPMTGEFISYQVPTYFGMMVAGYEPEHK